MLKKILKLENIFRNEQSYFLTDYLVFHKQVCKNLK
jgi:hypothetical protein